MAMMADNVPAVQALGQCIFLPMLIIGGIAVPIATLPDWAQHLSQFFPGRYAVQALQACILGPGLGTTGFELLALMIIGAGGAIAGAKMFRWDAQQRFARRSGKAWVSVALVSWIIVGALAEYRGRAAASARSTADRTTSAPVTVPGPTSDAPSPANSSTPERSYFKRHGISIAQFVPSLLAAISAIRIVGICGGNLRRVFSGGDRLRRRPGTRCDFGLEGAAGQPLTGRPRRPFKSHRSRCTTLTYA